MVKKNGWKQFSGDNTDYIKKLDDRNQAMVDLWLDNKTGIGLEESTGTGEMIINPKSHYYEAVVCSMCYLNDVKGLKLGLGGYE